MRRVVLDTGCVVSALLFRHGSLAWLREAWQRGRFIPLADRDTAAELIRVLHYPKFKLSPDARESLLADYLPFVESVLPSEEHAEQPGLRDPHDLKFIALARRTAADMLVTGDSDILDIRKRMRDLAVLTPREFHELLVEGEPPPAPRRRVR